MRILILILFIPFLGSSQDLDSRIIDRHLKSMINMHFEIDILTQERERLKREIGILINTVKFKDDKINTVLDDNSVLRERESDLVDSINYYKISDFGKGVHITDLNNLVIIPVTKENKSLSRENGWLKFLIGVSVGAGLGIAVF